MHIVSPAKMRWQSAVKTTHIWVGLIFGAFLCITCLSGSIAVFRPELESVFSPKVAPSGALGYSPRLLPFTMERSADSRSNFSGASRESRRRCCS